MDHPSDDLSWVLVLEGIHDVFRVKEFCVIGGRHVKYKNPRASNLLVWVLHGDACKDETSHFCSLYVCSSESCRECHGLRGMVHGLYNSFDRARRTSWYSKSITHSVFLEILEGVIYRDGTHSRPDIGCNLGPFPYFNKSPFWHHVIGDGEGASIGAIIHLLGYLYGVIIHLVSDVDSIEFDE